MLVNWIHSHGTIDFFSYPPVHYLWRECAESASQFEDFWGLITVILLANLCILESKLPAKSMGTNKFRVAKEKLEKQFGLHYEFT